jgi:aminoglycoside phosphotransferase (APT) family kinase protein
MKLVLRRFVSEEWLREEPDLALHEAASLRKAAEVDVPTPDLIACDEKGDHCGVPAVLMTELPGSPQLTPANADSWLHHLAEALLPLLRRCLPPPAAGKLAPS